MNRTIPLFLGLGVLLCSCFSPFCAYTTEPFISVMSSEFDFPLDSATVLVAPEEPEYTFNLASPDGNPVLLPMPMNYNEVDIILYHGDTQSQVHFDYEIEATYSDGCGPQVKLLPRSVVVEGEFSTAFYSEGFSSDPPFFDFANNDIIVIYLGQ